MNPSIVSALIAASCTISVLIIGSVLNRYYSRSDKREQTQDDWGNKLLTMQATFQERLAAELEVEKKARREEVERLTTRIVELQAQIQAKDGQLQELQLTVKIQASEIGRLSEILHRINPRATDKMCVLFGTPACPYGLLWKEGTEDDGRTEHTGPASSGGEVSNSGDLPVDPIIQGGI